MVLIGFTKAFDTVNHSFLWTMFKKIGCCPERFLNFVAFLHTNIKAQACFKGGLSRCI